MRLCRGFDRLRQQAVSQPRPIIIAGAGIAGLSAAIAIARSGRKTLVLERASEPYELGAG
ncbi:MAG: FAD-binding protein, partial [Rhizobiales bacterium]|nr:FAD-binding protein [Hyphomicrobiales bacterium]